MTRLSRGIHVLNIALPVATAVLAVLRAAGEVSVAVATARGYNADPYGYRS